MHLMQVSSGSRLRIVRAMRERPSQGARLGQGVQDDGTRIAARPSESLREENRAY
jgi:hypothetical protein